MGIKSFFRKQLISWVLPSNVITWFKGKKTVLGLISLLLWFLIYGLPAICVAAICQSIPKYSIQAQEMLISFGLELDTELLKGGAGLTVIGLLDKIFNHWFSDLASGAAKKVKL